jgi:hypothetical protein
MRVFSLALLLCAISSAQDTTATIEGRVLDPSGRVITGAVVRATNTNTGYTRSQITSSSGGYHLSLPAGQFGNEGRNTVRGPGMANVDLSLLKSIPLEERARLQFRAEWFNIANHANFGLPDNDLASPNFGRVLEAGPPRLVQFGLKLVF